MSTARPATTTRTVRHTAEVQGAGELTAGRLIEAVTGVPKGAAVRVLIIDSQRDGPAFTVTATWTDTTAEVR